MFTAGAMLGCALLSAQFNSLAVKSNSLINCRICDLLQLRFILNARLYANVGIRQHAFTVVAEVFPLSRREEGALICLSSGVKIEVCVLEEKTERERL